MPASRLRSGKREPAAGPSRAARHELRHQRAAGVGDIQHGAAALHGQVARRIRRRQRGWLPRRIGRDQAHDGPMHLVRDLQHVLVGEAALDRVAVQQRLAAPHRAAPRPVSRRCRRRPAAPCSAPRRRTGWTDDRHRPAGTAGLGQARDDALVHLEARGPTDIVDTGVPATRWFTGTPAPVRPVPLLGSSTFTDMIQRSSGNGAVSTKPPGRIDLRFFRPLVRPWRHRPRRTGHHRW